MRELAQNTKLKILKEQFIPDHVFVHLTEGSIRFFDGNKEYTMQAGDGFLARKNQLAKFIVLEAKDEFKPVVFCFDELFLSQFQQKHQPPINSLKTKDAFIKVSKTELLDEFIRSLKPYIKGVMQLDEAFEDLKYEELLIILLKQQQELAGILFDFGIPQKINLEAFMNQNFTFNVSLERFAFLTGRSLSAFKRDFKTIFNDKPKHWLMQKRLQEAYFLIEKRKENLLTFTWTWVLKRCNIFHLPLKSNSGKRQLRC